MVTDLPDGWYALVTIANRAGVIAEVTTANNANNAAMAYLVLEEDSVRLD